MTKIWGKVSKNKEESKGKFGTIPIHKIQQEDES
jgi:hypothetical protein